MAATSGATLARPAYFYAMDGGGAARGIQVGAGAPLRLAPSPLAGVPLVGWLERDGATYAAALEPSDVAGGGA